jgi:hypothetical protein
MTEPERIMTTEPALRARVESVARGWQGEAARRREFSAVDPVADTLDRCSQKLLEALDDDALTEVTTRDFARLHRRSEQAVRRWCRLGLIVSRKDGAEYLIQRGTRPPIFTAGRAS